MDSVWPLGDSGLRKHSFVLSLILPHGLVVLHFVGLRAHALNPLKLLIAQNGGVLSGQSLSLLLCVGLVHDAFDARSSSGDSRLLRSGVSILLSTN